MQFFIILHLERPIENCFDCFAQTVVHIITITVMNSITNKYLALTTVATDYARRMALLRNRIFGEVVRPITPRTKKVVSMMSEKPMQLRPEIVQYYPRHVETHLLMKKLRKYGLFRDEHEDFKEEMKRLRILRGKGPTKKGEGKRAMKK